jgi:hypothetical protein
LVSGETALAGEGYIDAANHRIRIVFSKIPKEGSLSRYLKSTKGGWVYEQRF